MSDRTRLGTALGAALALAAVAFAGTARAEDAGVRVEHAAARMIVIPEARADISVTVQPGDPRLPVPRVRREGGALVVDGGLEGRIGSCGGFGVVFGFGRRRDTTMRVMVRGVGPLTLDHLPLITAHVPLGAAVATEGAVFGEVGPSTSLVFANSGCGDWRLGDVRGPLRVSLAGSGDVHAGSAGPVSVAISGSSDLTLKHAAGLDLDMAGSGDVTTEAVDGPVDAKIAGSGDVKIHGGHASRIGARVAGSGDFTFHGVAESLDAQVLGSGDVHVSRVTGPVNRQVLGSGDIEIGQ